MNRNAASPRKSHTPFTLRPYITGVAAVIVTALLANKLHDLVSCGLEHVAHSGFDIAYVVLLILLLYLLYLVWSKIARELWRVRTRGRPGRWLAQDRPRSHLVLFLSKLFVAEDDESRGRPKDFCLTGDLNKDLEQLAGKGPPHWPWEQMLRAMRAHVPKLSHVYCVVSQQSFSQAKWFHEIVGAYDVFRDVAMHDVCQHPNGLLEVISAKDKKKPPPDISGFDFEDYDQLVQALDQLVKHLVDNGVSESSIVVDFTGGQKVTSVVAMTKTYDSDVVAQYVQTGGQKDVYCYDVEFEKRRLDVPVK